MRRCYIFAALAIAMCSLAAPVAPPAHAQAAAAARLNPNTATAEQLAAVPNMTPALAAQIQAKKPFRRTSDFHAVMSTVLNAKQLQQTYAALYVPINLNTATNAEIDTISGMSRKMRAEFLEYRPYTSLEQFDKEIKKYVPPKEVARLRSYVTLN